MIAVEARVATPDDVRMVLTISMTVAEWRRLELQLGSSWPSWPVASAIRKAISALVLQVENVTDIPSE